MALPAAILDVDGTLVDTNYHHALSWYRAFRGHGIRLPIWRLHRGVGMGGDKFVAALAGEEVTEPAVMSAMAHGHSPEQLAAADG